jgi:hypothetical protein
MNVFECGSNWTIEEDFISQDLAVQAGHQAILLYMLRRLGGTPFATQQAFPDNIRRKAVVVDRNGLESSPNAVLFLRLLEVYDKTEEVTANSLNRFHLDPYDTGGHTVDFATFMEPESEKTTVVGLLGRILLRIKDPQLGGIQELELNQGDALHIERFVTVDAPTTFAMAPGSVRQPLTLING